jgi:ABC-type lipoprotein release transport system permease subunit
MFLLRLAVKNLSRYKRRTIITAVAIAVGIAMFLIVDSMLLGVEQESERNLKWYETASLRIHTRAWWEDRLFLPLDDAIEEPTPIVEMLVHSGYQAVSRTRFAAELILGYEEFGDDGYIPVTITAIGEDDGRVYRFGESLGEGRFFTPGEMDGLVLGSWLAEDIGAQVGSVLTVSVRGKGGFYEAFDAQVVGLVNCPNPNVNRTLVMMDIEAADQYLGMDGSVTNIDIRIADTRDLEAVQRQIQQQLDPSLVVLNWKDLAQDYLALVSSKQGGSYMILLLIFIIAAVGISNTMLMAMYERSGEIAMMRAMGMEGGALWTAFLLEAGLIGLLGSLIGSLLGILANLYLVEVGVDLSFMLRDLDMGFRITNVMYGAWNVGAFIIAGIGGTALSMLGAVLPIRRALKSTVVSALGRQ